MTTSALEQLDDIAEQSGYGISGRRRKVGYFGDCYSVSPNLLRSRVEREKVAPAAENSPQPPDSAPPTADRVNDLFFRQVQDYVGLRDAVRARVEQLNISRACLDNVAGLPSGLAGKLLSQGESKDVKRFGLLSLGLVLQATGLKMLLVDDRDALAKVQPMFEERDISNVRLNNDCRKSKGRRTPKTSSYVPRTSVRCD
jgi:hypothetical protein